MTDMKRLTISLSDDIVDKIASLKSAGVFPGCSYAEIIRRLILAGLESRK